MTDVLTQTAPEETSERLVPGLGDEPGGAAAEVLPPALLRRVRAGRNTAFDRLVFDLDGPVPGVRVQYVPELRHEGSGEVVPLRGRAVVQVDLSPAAAHTDDGRPTLTGPLPDLTGFAAFRQVADAGDFEAQLTWGIGVAARTGIRATTLTGPTRVAVDVWHAEPGTGDQLLRRGDVGAGVATWQWRLVQALRRPLAVDEHFGPATERATRDFQHAQHLTADGVVGPRSRAAMAAVLGL
ncbi:Putative peptidoglycan binding domain-containing protein [Geodermatophilus telluris]|uniref:Putative peptidoglycan binding domain-containing protein n=1 Tax=Geodermatophilus telluris TaxID=1190417 RepID=A0A1G6V3I8_9ACTN|nr:peptidoglycan-binding domain-containing protein [Geodermatophilus telluris]SDD48189.1 Putative peptidoglycan binding domain-containing protein [Geodermatophilus telluris]